MGLALGGIGAKLAPAIGSFFSGRASSVSVEAVEMVEFNVAPKQLPQLTQTTTDEVLQAAQAADRNGLTQAGRALQKHGNRATSAYPKVSQKPGVLNSEGQTIVEDILKSPNKTIAPNKYGGHDITDVTTGRGVRMDGNGKMMGFLEPSNRP